MSNWNDVTTTVGEGLEMIQNGLRRMERGPVSYYLEKLTGYAELLFDRFAPFKPGWRVALVASPKNCNDEDDGWYSCRHFLVPGATGTVESIDAGKDGFWVCVVFDRETWIDREGVEQPVTQKHTFCLHESMLEKSNT